MKTKKTFAVVLSGCGVFDGAEIHEATLTLLAIDRAGAAYEIFAPDIDQHHVVNHLTGEEMNEKRNVLVESARIARGKIKPLNEFDATLFDALVFPGGFGVAKNLSDFAFNGANCIVNTEVAKAVKDMVEFNKPIGALCIAPAIMAQILPGAQLTIGSDEETIKQIQVMGGNHQETDHGEIVIDKKYKLVTTPCYMLDATISQIATGAEKVIGAILAM